MRRSTAVGQDGEKVNFIAYLNNRMVTSPITLKNTRTRKNNSRSFHRVSI